MGGRGPAGRGPAGGQHRPRPLRHPEDDRPQAGRRPRPGGLAARCSDLELYQSEEDLGWARRIRLAARRARRPARQRHRPRALRPRRVTAEGGRPGSGRFGAERGRRVRWAGWWPRRATGAVRRRRAVRRRDPEGQFLVVGRPDLDKGADAIGEDELAAREDLLLRRLAGRRPGPPGGWTCSCWPPGARGCPGLAIEAAAMGLPLVLTDIRGCREVARHDRRRSWSRGAIPSVWPRHPSAGRGRGPRRRSWPARPAAALGSGSTRRRWSSGSRGYRRLFADRKLATVSAGPSRTGGHPARAGAATRGSMAPCTPRGSPARSCPPSATGSWRGSTRPWAADPQAVALVAETLGGGRLRRRRGLGGRLLPALRRPSRAGGRAGGRAAAGLPRPCSAACWRPSATRRRRLPRPSSGCPTPSCWPSPWRPEARAGGTGPLLADGDPRRPRGQGRRAGQGGGRGGQRRRQPVLRRLVGFQPAGQPPSTREPRAMSGSGHALLHRH